MVSCDHQKNLDLLKCVNHGFDVTFVACPPEQQKNSFTQTAIVVGAPLKSSVLDRGMILSVLFSLGEVVKSFSGRSADLASVLSHILYET